MKNCSSDEKQKSFAKFSTSYRLFTKNLKLKADSPASPLHANILVTKKRSNRSSLFASFFTVLELASSCQFNWTVSILAKQNQWVCKCEAQILFFLGTQSTQRYKHKRLPFPCGHPSDQNLLLILTPSSQSTAFCKLKKDFAQKILTVD